MRPTLTLVLAALLTLPGCARSAKDRELDRIFAHQRALRDTTSSVIGTVVDAETGAPIRGVYVRTIASADASDSAGRFVLRYVPKGLHTMVVRTPGYLADSATVDVDPRAASPALPDGTR